MQYIVYEERKIIYYIMHTTRVRPMIVAHVHTREYHMHMHTFYTRLVRARTILVLCTRGARIIYNVRYDVAETSYPGRRTYSSTRIPEDQRSAWASLM